MTFAWASENWNRDRQERQREDSERTHASSASTDVSLKEWLDSRAQYVTSLPKHPQELSRNQQRRDIWKAPEEDQAGTETPKSRDLKDWLLSREQKVGAARKSAINLTAAFSRPTFVPDPSPPLFTPRAASAASNHVSSNTPPQEVSSLDLPYTTTKHSKPNHYPIRLTGGQLFLTLSRLVLEVNWDWFHANRHNFVMSDITPATSQQWWNDIRQVYVEYCKEASQGVDALMKLYQQSKSGDHVLNIEQTVLNPMLRFLVGYKVGRSVEERGKAVLEALLLEGDFLAYVMEWCQCNGMEYPGGTGRTQERLKEYALGSLPTSEAECLTIYAYVPTIHLRMVQEGGEDPKKAKNEKTYKEVLQGKGEEEIHLTHFIGAIKE
ncbi:hypothetical protein DL98DRAFT_534568 [Cadophora sp. DSE1049]|nr:hypothetical protein DL98DRAFT_534568 [Cadophora sp. DSE1049]